MVCKHLLQHRQFFFFLLKNNLADLARSSAISYWALGSSYGGDRRSYYRCLFGVDRLLLDLKWLVLLGIELSSLLLVLAWL